MYETLLLLLFIYRKENGGERLFEYGQENNKVA